MKRLKQQLYSDPIPVDILIDIFSRVPRKSIDRFRCVSKFWGYVVRRPDFTELFLTKSSTRPRILFTVKDKGKLLFYSSPQPQNPDDNSTLVATRYHTSFPKYVPSDSDECSTVGGLALLYEVREGKVSVICNPITGEFLTLPKVLLKDKTLTQVKAKGFKKAKAAVPRICLGYDPISKQFKVLCVISSGCEGPNTHQVLTLESGKPLWRRIECEFHFNSMFDNICINGVLYFRAKLGETSVVVCFDVRSEKFGFINLDKDVLGEEDDDYDDGRLALFNYKGKLGLREGTDYWSTKDELVLWVLEDAANHKWSKLTYELPRFLRREQFVGMTRTGDIVFLSFPFFYRPNNFCLYFYNLQSETVAKVNLNGFEEFKNYRAFDIFLDYVENLKFT
ncbi:unnamed protein product [Microthlaspi erraticum]|uniref:F-box domain-containing protein n=1 Tax=Microthlaspi erraticum TaxID=1685480 RepID=A0A6D2J0W6_9BRAS|nr:unnamed protein product [Microthlaspi erraticum]